MLQRGGKGSLGRVAWLCNVAQPDGSRRQAQPSMLELTESWGLLMGDQP
jgi:hypothetical protein